jgi:hypothetical protein
MLCIGYGCEASKAGEGSRSSDENDPSPGFSLRSKPPSPARGEGNAPTYADLANAPSIIATAFASP